MLWNLGNGWLLMAIAVVAILSFILGLVVDAIMREDGFGPVGNAVIIAAGFFTGIFAGNSYGLALSDMRMAAAAGLTGAMVALTVLSGIKAGLNRIF